MNQPWLHVAPGAIWRGWWAVEQFNLPALPILAAHGMHDGPTVVITGAVHGDEYEGTAAIHRLFNELDPTAFAGRVIGLPIVNPSAWRARSRSSPLDGIDLNRVFPRPPANHVTSPSYALAESLFTIFIQPCDVLIDLHSGGAKLVHLPMVGWYTGDKLAEHLARCFDSDLYPWLIPDRAGVLSCEARRVGKVALGVEWGGGAKLDNLGVAVYTAGLRRVLAILMGRDREFVADQRPPLVGSYQLVDAAGLFVSSVGLGDRVAVGDPLGTIYDPLGQVVTTVRAAWSGIVAALAHNALLEAGDRVAYIG